ncbi:ATP/GTP-binding protein [Herbiconiux sp. VKM Ac-1786]|uniref:ATP/GTP-binding protein n=1 Tax=Herbiconiux sp. VKM Ac-1786 TaxID=2783824 RepID=UPI00188A8C59|nr:ATP/GTP-binding protein [Herbiconiux sp. VKM Ac-1786]MBF4573180.1 ATP/GTP-binding protein [Herbiconiux sp. VKM Ac-1786]
MAKRVLEQHIAVFGESGSGKSVLISSFYGLMREKRTLDRTRLDVVADDAGQGGRLYSNYLGMKQENRAPEANRFSAIPYSFTARLEHRGERKTAVDYDGIRLIWHDYPGEWFHESPSGPEEERRRADTFRSLLASDVAMVLIDAEELVRNAGHEERYLKLLFTNVRNGLLPIVDDLLEDSKPLARFPRIWMFALSKCDVLPDLKVQEFQDLVVLKTAHEVDQLRQMLGRIVLDKDAFAVGEDFVLLSSAKFSPGAIEVSQRVGVDLIMPIASVFPLRRFMRWAEARNFRGKVVEVLFGRASAAAGVVAVLVGLVSRAARLPGPVGAIAVLISSVLSKEAIEKIVKLAGGKLREANEDALEKGDYLRAALTQFGIDLEDAEAQNILLRSRR